MRELTFTVIGAAFWGQFQIAAWKEVPGARLVALCDLDPVKASALARKSDIPRSYTNAEEMLRSEALDFVKVNPHFAGEDIVAVILGYDQITCHCQLSWRTTGYEVFIEGAEGTITGDPRVRRLVGTDAGETSERLAPEDYPWADPRYGFAHASIVFTNTNLAGALGGECTAETTAEDNLATMRLLHLALESASRNQVLPV